MAKLICQIPGFVKTIEIIVNGVACMDKGAGAYMCRVSQNSTSGRSRGQNLFYSINLKCSGREQNSERNVWGIFATSEWYESDVFVGVTNNGFIGDFYYLLDFFVWN